MKLLDSRALTPPVRPRLDARLVRLLRGGLGLALAVAIAIAVTAAVGCYSGPDATLSPPAAPPDASVEAGAGADDAPVAAPAAALTDGLPCDVAALLATSCVRCHGVRPRNGAPMSLVTYEDLVAPWDDDPTRTIAELSLERMRSVQAPMPPGAALPASAAAVLDAWVSAGTPRVSCRADGGAGGDGDGDGDGGLLPDPDPFDAGAPAVAVDGGAWLDAGVCTSGTTWSPGSPASALMAPGRRCLGCHYLSGGPSLTLAGTVYPSLHEPDDCAGTATNVSVVIVDAAGKSHKLPVNAAGNFLRVTGLPMPYTARVISGSGTAMRVREMVAPQTDGDCNGCHTAAGGGAPGRITAP